MSVPTVMDDVLNDNHFLHYMVDWVCEQVSH